MSLAARLVGIMRHGTGPASGNALISMLAGPRRTGRRRKAAMRMLLRQRRAWRPTSAAPNAGRVRSQACQVSEPCLCLLGAYMRGAELQPFWL